MVMAVAAAATAAVDTLLWENYPFYDMSGLIPGVRIKEEILDSPPDPSQTLLGEEELASPGPPDPGGMGFTTSPSYNLPQSYYFNLQSSNNVNPNPAPGLYTNGHGGSGGGNNNGGNGGVGLAGQIQRREQENNGNVATVPDVVGDCILVEVHEDKRCKVCGDEATGMYFGALVCVPCKTFFLRYAGDNFSFICKQNRNCEITTTSRTQCKYCRYQKCLQVGMCRKERPAKVELTEGQQLCVVCSDVANGVHFGAITCEGCKKFFRRGLTENHSYVCKNEFRCDINPRTRNSCRFCRYQKCLHAGMSREAIQMGRPSKFKPSHSSDEGRPPKMMRLLSAYSSPNPMSPDSVFPRILAPDSSSELSQGLLSPGAPSNNNNRGEGANYNKSGLSQSDIPQNWLSGLLDGFVFEQSLSNVPSLSGGLVSSLAPLPTTTLSVSVTMPTVTESLPSPTTVLASLSVREKEQLLASLSDTPPRMSLGSTGSDISISTSSSGSSTRQSGKSNTNAAAYDTFVQEAVNTFPTQLSQEQRTISSPTGTSTRPAKLHIPEKAMLPNPEAEKSQVFRASSQALDIVFNILRAARGDKDVSGGELLQQLQQLDPHSLGVTQYTPVVPRPSPQSSQPTVPYPNPPPSTTSSKLSTSSRGKEPLSSVSSPGGSVVEMGGVGSPQSDLGELSFSNKPSPLSVGKSPAEMNTKSPGSCSTASGASSTSNFGENGSMYNVALELSKNMDLIKRDSSSSAPEKKNASFSDLMGSSQEKTLDLGFKNFECYWLQNKLPDENVIFGDEHCRVLDQILPAYQRFVETSTSLNRSLKAEMDKWSEQHEGQFVAPMSWINEKVVPIYTLASVTYCKDLPGFVDFDSEDQTTIIKLGQSQSRILVAAVHWYDPQLEDFRDFMSWRGMRKGTEDSYKKNLLGYAKNVHELKMDEIEAALLNVLILIATDYPDLKNPQIIEEKRHIILSSFRAYTTATYGTPNNRMECLVNCIPQLRTLGLAHHKMTFSMK